MRPFEGQLLRLFKRWDNAKISKAPNFFSPCERYWYSEAGQRALTCSYLSQSQVANEIGHSDTVIQAVATILRNLDQTDLKARGVEELTLLRRVGRLKCLTLALDRPISLGA